MRGWKTFVSALMLWVSSSAFSFDFNSSYYGVYETGANIYGCAKIFIVPKSSFLIIGVDQPTPIMFMPQTTGFQGWVCSDGSLSGFTKVNLTANDMAAQGATPSNYKIFGGDFDGDGKPDFFLQGSGSVRNSVVLTADASGTPQVYANFYGALDSTVYTQINILDVDQNGRSDIVATDTSGNVITYFSSDLGNSFSSANNGSNNTTLVGAINGKFRVDESGNSTYSVDILTAAGTAGVAPHISLNYSSGGGDGVLGAGWSIGGLSEISRCRQTLAQDGNSTAITLSVSDRFCLDGQRLILTSGAYGQGVATYRKEIDDGSVITSYAYVSGNPGYFTVQRRDGSLSYYGDGSVQGNNGSAPGLNGNGFILAWSISRFQDSVGNAMRFSYSFNANTNEHLLTRIDYAYGTDKTATSASSTYLQFNYQGRPDVSSGYVAGSQIWRTQRLTSVYSYSNGNEIRHYAIAYRTTDSTHYQSYVQQLFECAGNNCLSPTTFNWDLNNGGFQNGNAVATVSGAAPVAVRTMDINGDGKPDLVWMQLTAPYQMYYQLWSGSGYLSAVPFATVADGNTNWMVLDYNNDGFQDLLIATANQTWKLYLGSAGGLNSGSDTGIPYKTINTGLNSYAGSSANSAAVFDINGDGLPDFVDVSAAPNITYRTAQLGIANNQWTHAFAAPQTVTTGYGNGGSGCQGVSVIYADKAADFNGDGNVDLPITSWFVPPPQMGGSIINLCSGALIGNGAGAFTANMWTTSQSQPTFQLSFVDLNGDGLPDKLWAETPNGSSTTDYFGWKFTLNTGNGFGAAKYFIDQPTVLPGVMLVDYNADGYPDVIYGSGGNLVVRTYNTLYQAYNPAVTTALPYQAASSSGAADQDIFIDADGDGHVDLLRVQNTTSQNIITLYKSNDAGKVGNKITSIDNGLGNTTSIAYKPLTDTSVYTKGTDANDASKWTVFTPPVFDIVAPSYVVASVTSTAPKANDNTPNAINYSATDTVSYQYAGLKMQSMGRGSLGFASITAVDQQTSVKTVTYYNQRYPFVGQPAWTLVWSPSNQVIKSSVNNYTQNTFTGADGTHYFQVYANQVLELTNDPVTANEISFVITTTDGMDSWGNITGTTASTYSASDHTNYLKQVKTSNTYGASTYEQQFGRLANTTVTHRRAGAADMVRTSSFTYYGSGDGALQGLLKTEQVSTPDGSTSALTTYQYDQFGNKKCVSVGVDTNLATNCTPSTGNRYEITDYDGAGRYVIDKQSPFNSSSGWINVVTEQIVSRNALGLPLQINSLNGVVTNFTYDALGREASRSDNTGASMTTTYARYGSVSGAQYNVTTTASTGATATQYFDALGRGIAKWQRGYDGSWITTETEYDYQNRVKRQSVPHYYGAAVYWAINNYDNFRLQSQIVPTANNTQLTLCNGISVTTCMSYGGLTSTVTNALSQTRTEVRNAAGELLTVTDYVGGTINYTYDAAGQMIQTATTGKQNGATTTINSYLEYDQLGRKNKMRDSDKGTWFYVYNNYGDLTDQYKVMSTNNYTGTLAQALADSSVQMQRTHIDYDKRGRMIARTDYREGGAIETVSTWTYDTATNGVGQLAQESGGGLARTYAYDTLGRPVSTMHNDGNGAYLLTVAYDNFGRPYKSTDALGTGSGTISSYNGYGYLQSVVDIAANTALYSVVNMDARGNVTSAILGNGATTNWSYDAGSGLLTNQTTTNVLGVTLQRLDYTWDALGNQTSRWDRSVQNAATNTYKSLQQSFCYDGLNRLTKTNQGSLNGACSGTQDQQYDDFGGIVSKNNIGTYTYNSASPHQLQSTGDGVAYTYDKVGNLISDSSGRTLHYTVFDKADLITKGSNQIGYVYGADRNYYKRVDSASSGTSTTYYIGNIEKVVKADGTYDMKRYLAGVALWNHHFNNAGTQTSLDKQYMYKDTLGSVVLITDNAGSVKQQYAFNSWGERVDTTNWQTVLPSANFMPVSQQFTTHSFTGQDALDAVGLINYGGRIYDARLARFIQADPFVQDGMDTQAYNRYAYVRNNPLTLSDPSGFSWLSKAWHRTKHAMLGQTQMSEMLRFQFRIEDFMHNEFGFIRSIDNYTASHSWVQMIGTAVATYYGGAAGAAYAAAHNAHIQGAGVDDARNAAIIAGASSFAFSYIGGYYGDTWTLGRVGWTAVAGGATSYASGGSFKDGFLMSGGIAMASWGYSEMKVATDSYKQTSCAQGLSVCKYVDGEVLTDGGRGSVPGSDTGTGNWITNGGMANEASGEHIYSEDSLVGKYVNAISKAHDWFNSDLSKGLGFKGYDAATGMWIAGGDTYNTLFQLYSFSGMLPAAVFTTAALSEPYVGVYLQSKNQQY